MNTYYLHISYMIPLANGACAHSDAMVEYKGLYNITELRKMLRDCDKSILVDKDKLPNIISIDILPKELFEALTHEK